MTDEALCILCARRPAVVGYLCAPDVDRLGRRLDPANRGIPFDPDDPAAPVRPPSIPVLYRELADLAPAGSEREHEHADAARVDWRRIALRDSRSKATGANPDDDGVDAPRSVLATLGGWARVVHEEHVDVHGRPDPLPTLARPGWVEAAGPTTRMVEVTVTDRVARGWIDAVVGDDERTPAGTPLPDRLVEVRAPGPAALRRHGVAGQLPDVQAVEVLCRWLHARLEWLARQLWVDELMHDLRALTAQLRAGHGDPGARPLGPCRALVDDDGAPDEDGRWSCWEPLWMPPTPPRAPDEAVVLPPVCCPSCGTVWQGLALLQLARERGIEPTDERVESRA